MRKYSRCRWLELVEGILLIILGIITLVFPTSAFWGFSIIYGVMAIVTGIADIIFYVKMEKYMGFGPVLALVSGVISVLAGAMLDRKSTRLNSSHNNQSRMPSSA